MFFGFDAGLLGGCLLGQFAQLGLLQRHGFRIAAGTGFEIGLLLRFHARHGDGVQFAVGVNQTHARAFSKLAIQAKDAEISVASEERIARDHRSARGAVVGQKSSNGPRS